MVRYQFVVEKTDSSKFVVVTSSSVTFTSVNFRLLSIVVNKWIKRFIVACLLQVIAVIMIVRLYILFDVLFNGQGCNY